MDKKSIVADYTPLNPRCCSIYTIRARMCPESRQRQQGTEWCERCQHPCEWGTEYIRRHRQVEFRPSTPKRELETVYRHRKRGPKPFHPPVGGGTSQIPYFGGWLGEYLNEKGISMSRLARAIGYSCTVVCSAVKRNYWSREFERRVMLVLNLDEQLVTQQAAAWAWRNGLQGHNSISPD